MNITAPWVRPLPDLDAVPASAHEIRGTYCRTTIDLFAEWSTVLGFPELFAHSWDSLGKCLRHVTEDDDTGPVTLVLHNAALLLEDEDPDQLRALLEVLDSVDFGLLLVDDSTDDLRRLAHRMAEAGFDTELLTEE
ncbi:barstar family protein [Streptomyces sp. SID13726]|uniref:barstar family protein n=1 Tax=Streptomyces sp. SID13726 TaxID=2706058 RepID=UPI0013BDEBC9|nr:barstar family protein [Streptomyces sp. SID13726]NEA99030.1 barstar family protein [Streptomyces sp. SID13726]